MAAPPASSKPDTKATAAARAAPVDPNLRPPSLDPRDPTPNDPKVRERLQEAASKNDPLAAAAKGAVPKGFVRVTVPARYGTLEVDGPAGRYNAKAGNVVVMSEKQALSVGAEDVKGQTADDDDE